ncbi:MAG: hypothetical protein JXA71_11830 [Chitinispirillaceae bacterium]|nr:hypothetical protein [Chitinispirillaceae bacterium]
MILRLSLLLPALLLPLGCANLTGGGGSDIGNGVVMGSVVTANEAPVSGVQVTLVPYFHDPVAEPSSPYCLSTATDANGSFVFSLFSNGTYNIEAVNPHDGTRALVTDIPVRLNDTLPLPPLTMGEPGSITVYLPDSVDITGGYLYIQGTTMWLSLLDAESLAGGVFMVTFDSVPAATLPSIYYMEPNATAQPVMISQTTSVSSNGVSVVDADISWSHFTADNTSLPREAIRDIAILPDGTRWFATSGGGAARLQGEVWTVYNGSNSPMPSTDIHDISYENNGTVWFATTKGAVSFGGGQWVVYTPENTGLPSAFVNDIRIDRQGRKWFATSDAGLATYDGYSWECHNTGNSAIPSNTIHRIAIENNPALIGGQAVWCATALGAAVFCNYVWTVYTTLNSGIFSDRVFSIKIDRFGNKWFGHENGVSRFDGFTWTTWSGVPSALSASVLTIAEDGKGAIWFGTLNGLVKFNGASWTEFSGERYRLLENCSIYSLAIDASDNKWIGTSTNGVIMFGPGTIYTDPTKRRMPKP